MSSLRLLAGVEGVIQEIKPLIRLDEVGEGVPDKLTRLLESTKEMKVNINESLNRGKSTFNRFHGFCCNEH